MNFGFLLAIFPHRRSSWRGKSRTLGPNAGRFPTGDQAPWPRALVTSYAPLASSGVLSGQSSCTQVNRLSYKVGHNLWVDFKIFTYNHNLSKSDKRVSCYFFFVQF